MSVEIALGDGTHIVKRHTVGNAWVEAGFITRLNMDPSNADPEFFIRIPDRTSTYGAESGIIVYRLQWWEFLLVPDDRFSVEDLDRDGVFELVCHRIQDRAYSLVQGVLREKDRSLPIR